MTPAYEFLVVEPQDGIIRVQKVGVEDDLDTVVGVVEKLDAPELVQDRIRRIVGHVVRRDRR